MKQTDLSNVTQLPQVNENKVLPLGSFILPQKFVEGLMTPQLEPFESRLVREVNRLEVWVHNLQTQLEAAHHEIERLQALQPHTRDKGEN